jgi:hypothetical protein
VTFLDALIWIGASVDGMRPMRAGRLRTWKAEVDDADAVALLEVAGPPD